VFPLVPILKFSVAVCFLAFSLHIKTIVAVFLQFIIIIIIIIIVVVVIIIIIISAFASLLGILENFSCLKLVPQINAVPLLDARQTLVQFTNV
jgi:hypothetical protein